MTKTPRAISLLPLGMTLLLGFGCQGDGKKGDKNTGDAAGGTSDGPQASGGQASGGQASGGGSAGGQSGSAGSGGSTNTCYVDFPCRSPFRCVSSDSYVAQLTISCKEVCPPGPCSGGMCRDTGSPIACPAGTRCVATDGFHDVTIGCQAVLDAGAGDTRMQETIDAPLGEAGSLDAPSADRRLKDPVDARAADLPSKPPLDAVQPDVVAVCEAGQRRCKANGLVLQSCTAAGQWRDERTCDFTCRDGACAGECMPGDAPRCRANANTPQTCAATNTWVDGSPCSGSTPYCATGQCVAACLDEGQDCSDSTSACCAGSQCVAANGNTDIHADSSKFVCKAIPACAALGAACSANTDCCAGLDCTAGTCVAKQTACLDTPAAGVCGGNSGATCCPGTTCDSQYSFEPLGCMIPTTTRPQESDCPRERPAFHEACRAASLGLTCTYSDWVKASGVFFRCTCSYHGWSCTKGYYVH